MVTSWYGVVDEHHGCRTLVPPTGASSPATLPDGAAAREGVPGPNGHDGPHDGGMSTRPVSVVLADDHPVVRGGLRALLSTIEGVEVVGEAADGETAVK